MQAVYVPHSSHELDNQKIMSRTLQIFSSLIRKSVVKTLLIKTL
jgi:hypothetical protein